MALSLIQIKKLHAKALAARNFHDQMVKELEDMIVAFSPLSEGSEKKKRKNLKETRVLDVAAFYAKKKLKQY
jgi:hypothetical protein